MRRLGLLVLAIGCNGPDEGPSTPTDPDAREACADNNPLRNLYFGDLHVHTSWSFDAWIFDVRNDPWDAYAFAQGVEVGLPPLDASGEPLRKVKLARPLDFAAVTDHGEYLGEVQSCITPSSPVYETETCQLYRGGDQLAVTRFGLSLTPPRPERIDDLCGHDGVDCLDLAGSVWTRLQEAAEDAYDRTATCSFTSFVAYEYSAATAVSNLHRNVIFRGTQVPVIPASYFEFPTAGKLWDELEATCLEAGTGCDVMAIPHNSNWSNGNLFAVEYPEGATLEEQRAAAERRARMEPLVEIYQHKGDSECTNGLATAMGAPDEACDFEKLRQPPFEDCRDGTGGGAMAGIGCVSRFDFVRGVLVEGLKEQARVGVNPYALGIIASTDTHNGTPGLVDEATYPGHWGNNEDTPALRLDTGIVNPGGIIYSGGGLTAVWAEENSREALFDALRRKEVYGTSGPRIPVRMFAGWDLPLDACARADLVEVGYRDGVPMGGTLLGAGGGAPRVVVQAWRDPGVDGVPGTPLQRVQIIKGWLDEAGEGHHQVFDVAVAADPDASVDTDTCETHGGGDASLCAVWSDPDFDPEHPALYYARVLEDPTCRWSTWTCNALPEDQRPPTCDDATVPKTIQERAWTSPIWFDPGD